MTSWEEGENLDQGSKGSSVSREPLLVGPTGVEPLCRSKGDEELLRLETNEGVDTN